MNGFRIIVYTVIMMAMTYSSSTFATCFFSPNLGTINFPAVTLTASEKGVPNTVLYQYTIPISQIYYSCGQSIVSTWKSEFVRPQFSATSIPNTYTTGIPGVGVRIKWPESRGQNAWIPGSYSCSGNCYEPADKMIIEFVQIGTIQAGELSAGNLVKISLFAADNPKDIITMLNISIGKVDVNIRSCSIYASNNSVDLGEYSLMSISKSGFQGDMKEFSITLDCPEKSSAKIQFDGTNPWGMSSGTLASTGSAKYAYTRLYSKLGTRYTELKLNTLINFGSAAPFTGIRKVDYAARMFFDDVKRNMVTAGNVSSNVVYTLSIN